MISPKIHFAISCAQPQTGPYFITVPISVTNHGDQHLRGTYQRGSERRPPLPPPKPRLLLKPRPPPPPPPRFSRGLASLTFKERPPTSLPLNCSIAESASS